MFGGQHADVWLDPDEKQYKFYPVWKGVLAWALLILIGALIFF